MRTSTTYYINENENVFQFLADKDIALSATAYAQLSFISKKTHNNYIGYYQFLTNGQYVKFFVMPKIHAHVEEAGKEQAFFNFFTRYYRLSNKYPEITRESIDGNIVDMSFNDALEAALSANIDDFIRYKYIDALNTLTRFFKKHNKTQHRYIAYTSQSINHKIDLKNNIRSLNKANVHQTKREAEAYSEIALITEQALKQFKLGKIEQIQDAQHQEELASKTNTVLALVKKKNKRSDALNVKDRDIIKNRIRKLFKGNKALAEVYEALLIIIGFEHFQSQEAGQNIEKMDNMVALFFNPADLFEWIVYDELREKYPTARIKKDKLAEGTSAAYSLETAEKRIEKASKPDFILENNEFDKTFTAIIDAKWKILTRLEDVKFEDIAKLERDFLIRKAHCQQPLKAILIYPNVHVDSLLDTDITLDYAAFTFRIGSVSV